MTEVHTFRAKSMQEALALVRRDLGVDAVVVQTREVSRRRLVFKQRQVEVTATRSANARHFDAGLVTSGGSSRAAACHDQASGLFHLRTYDARSDAGLDLLREPEPADAESSVCTTTQSSDPDLLSNRLETIEALLDQVAQRVPELTIDNLPPALFQQYADLIEADVPDEIARQLVTAICCQSDNEWGTSPDSLKQQLQSEVESRIRCGGGIRVTPGVQKVVALVGPTGVGKTTTIAKLAANFRLREGVKLGLVTVDTYRVAAVEQLRTYAEIIDLPMRVVTTPLEMRRAIDDLSDMDLILIDTAGRSPREELQLQELKALLTEAHVDEVHLVLSLATSPRVLQMTAKKFDLVGVNSVVLTKLDEAAGMGTLLSAAEQVGHPLSYFTTGQNVPDDIELATAARAARLIMGKDDLY